VIGGSVLAAASNIGKERPAVRQGSFDGHPWPWLPSNVLRRQMANLHSFVVTGPKAGAIGKGKLLKAKRSSSPRACRGNGVAVNEAARPTDSRVAEHDCPLMRLAAPSPVGWPEPGSLEAQQPVRLHVA